MALNLYLDKMGVNVVGALADGNRLIEYHVEKIKKNQVVGSIYKGKVQNVLNGMQAAFVDVGLEKNGYGSDDLQTAGCTIAVTDMVKAAVKAATVK